MPASSAGRAGAWQHRRVSVVVFTDGACQGNPGPGGWAWARTDGPWARGAEARSTNQRMEIAAVLEALQALEGEPGPVEVRSDSTYVVNCFRDRWWEGWLRKGWKNSQRKPVANRDLWEPLIELVRGRGDVSFTWVKVHSGDPMNDLVDALAVTAAAEQRRASGDEHPAEVGPPDRPGRGRGGDAPSSTADAGEAAGLAGAGEGIEGHALVVAGHRPPELGGYEVDNPVATAVRRRLTDILAATAELHDDLVVATGMGLGAEQLGAVAALDVGVPFVAVLPYPDVDAVWPAEARQRFGTLRDQARDVVVLQRRVPASKQQAGAALRRRDAWLARAADQAVVVWDGVDDLVGRQVRTFEDRLGDDVWTIDPNELTAR